MAVAKKKLAKRKYRRYRRLGFATNYFRNRIDVVYLVKGGENTSAVPEFYIGNQGGAVVTFEGILLSSPAFPTIKALFAYYRIYGIALDWRPTGDTSANSTVNNPVYIVVKPGTNTSSTLNEAISNDHSLIAGAFCARKYTSLLGGTSWTSSSQYPLGNLTVVSGSTIDSTNQHYYGAVKVSLYIQFKKQVY